MNRFEPLDPADPFGTRPDEKPPDGWDARFWDEVRREIEARKDDPEARRLPDPPPPASRRRSVAAFAGLLAAAALLSLYARAPEDHRTVGKDDSLTLIKVECCEQPEVDVEWARRDGRHAEFVVLRSLEPDISYVVLAPPPVTP